MLEPQERDTIVLRAEGTRLVCKFSTGALLKTAVAMYVIVELLLIVAIKDVPSRLVFVISEPIRVVLIIMISVKIIFIDEDAYNSFVRRNYNKFIINSDISYIIVLLLLALPIMACLEVVFVHDYLHNVKAFSFSDFREFTVLFLQIISWPYMIQLTVFSLRMRKL